MIKMRKAAGMSLLAAGALALAGCGGSTDSGSGVVTFAMTDAPVTDATSVVIAMTEMELKPAEGPSISFPLDKEVDLLTLTNGTSTPILEGVEVPAGEYEWVRIFFDEEGSHVMVEGGGQHSFFMPSGAQTGFKVVGGFTVPVNDSVEFILDFDLQKSLIEPRGMRGRLGEDRGFLLKPTIRLMEMAETGGVTGTVAAELLADNDTSDPAVCDGGDAVYAFEGADVDVNDPANIPLVTDIVDFDAETQVYEYHFMYLLPGDYTLAFTCSASSDGGDGEDYVFTPGALGFGEPVTVSVAEGEIGECNLAVDGWDCAPETEE